MTKLSAGWKFRHLPDDQKHSEPTHSQEFGRNGAARSLVRESIQNSLDARLDPAKPVRVRMKLGRASGAKPQSFFDGLWPHVDAVRKFLKCAQKQDEFPYLTVEDFNTRGLCGDVEGGSPGTGDNKNHFFCFWHKVGQSSNDHKTLGNRGVGKVAFQVASEISTFFGLTRRSNDPDSVYLMGEAGLVTHEVASHSRRFDWYGYYASRTSEQARVKPITDANVLASFVSSFCIKDGRKDSGLSVVVPYVDKKIDAAELAYQAIDSYLLNFARGDLCLEIEDYDSKVMIVDRGTLIKTCESLARLVTRRQKDFAELQLMADLAVRMASEESGSTWLSFNANLDADTGSKQYSLVPLSDELLAQAKVNYVANGSIAARIHVEVKRSDSDSADADSGERVDQCVILVLGQQDTEASRAGWHHLRCGLHVSKLRDGGPPGSRGIVAVGRLQAPGLLAQLLQKSEEAAHDNWQVDGPEYKNAKESFANARELIFLCRNAARKVLEKLRPSSAELNKVALASLLPVVSSTGAAKRRRPGPKPVPDAADGKGPVGEVAVTVCRWPGSREVDALAAVPVILCSRSGGEKAIVSTIISDSKGQVCFTGLAGGDYELQASHPEFGEARDSFTLPNEHGVYRKLVLTKVSPPPALQQTDLPNGFSLQYSAKYRGALGQVKISLKYAAFGKNSEFVEGDFDLKSMEVACRGVRETVPEMIRAPNVLVCTPVDRAFEIKVTGFDRRFALDVDARHLLMDVNEDSSEDVTPGNGPEQ